MRSIQCMLWILSCEFVCLHITNLYVSYDFSFSKWPIVDTGLIRGFMKGCELCFNFFFIYLSHCLAAISFFLL